MGRVPYLTFFGYINPFKKNHGQQVFLQTLAPFIMKYCLPFQVVESVWLEVCSQVAFLSKKTSYKRSYSIWWRRCPKTLHVLLTCWQNVCWQWQCLIFGCQWVPMMYLHLLIWQPKHITIYTIWGNQDKKLSYGSKVSSFVSQIWVEEKNDYLHQRQTC